MAEAQKKSLKLPPLTEFEKKNDLILTAKEEKTANKIRYTRSYIRKLKVATRADETRPATLPRRNPVHDDTNAINQTGYMPSFAARVALGSDAQKAEFNELIAMTRTRENAKDYRKRMSNLRRAITAPTQVGTDMANSGQGKLHNSSNPYTI